MNFLFFLVPACINCKFYKSYLHGRKYDDLGKCLDKIENKYSVSEVPQLKICIQNYYQLELENKRRMQDIECYQFQLFIVIIIITVYLICLRFSYV